MVAKRTVRTPVSNFWTFCLPPVQIEVIDAGCWLFVPELVAVLISDHLIDDIQSSFFFPGTSLSTWFFVLQHAVDGDALV